MRMIPLCATSLVLAVALPADAQIVRGWRENAAGGVNAVAAHDVYGPYGSRSVGQAGVVTNGDGAGVGGSRGCSRGVYGGEGCRAGATSRNEDGDFYHESGAAGVGAFGNSAGTYGSFEREDGYGSGQRDSELNVGDRTYNATTTFNTDDGFDRDVTCTQSSGGRC
jgi:hypothetical protein